MSWRVANSLLKLRNQANAKFPKRSKVNDGTIGDARHATRASDHNPWVDNQIVTALDLTHDPKNGLDSYQLAEELRLSRDGRIKYVISNRRICSSTVEPWAWRKYSGSNPHTEHVHISVVPEQSRYDDERPWELPMLEGERVHAVPEPLPPPPDIEPVPPPEPEGFFTRFWKWLNSL